LQFSPLPELPAATGARNYKATKPAVWISLNIDSNTWNMTPERRGYWFQEWLNVTDPKITCRGSIPGCTYYAACHLELTDHQKTPLGG
jgi:hypothetical protein